MNHQISARSLLGLDSFILMIAGFQIGMGPFLAVYLKNNLKWDPYQIGLAIGLANFAIMLNQIPSGLLIDASKNKRLIAASACLILCISSFLISQFSSFHSIAFLQVGNGLACAIILPIITALSLGLVGKTQFPKRITTNAILFPNSNVLLTICAGLSGYFINPIWILYTFSIFSFGAIFPLLLINSREINHKVARLLISGDNKNLKSKILPINQLLKFKPIIILLISVTLYHFSTAAQITLMSQLFVINNPITSPAFFAASIIVAHLFMMIIAIGLRYWVERINHKPLFILAFFLTGLKSLLLTISHHSIFLVSVQIIDGLSAGIYGVISLVMITELAKNTGRFNFMHGLVSLFLGLGYTLSNAISGFIAHLFGFNIGFYSLAVVAFIGMCFFAMAMPETRNKIFFHRS